MRFSIATVVVSAVLVTSCGTFSGLGGDLVEDSNHAIEVPRNIDQEDWTPAATESPYNTQSILYNELASRFYQLGERAAAKEYFRRAVQFDRYNGQAHFGLGTMAYEEGDHTTALFHFQQIRPQERLAPYDIDYHAAAQMFLDFYPFRAQVTAIDPREFGSDTPVVTINKGRNQGVTEGMEFTFFRQGTQIRDVESLEIIGQQRTRIATGVVTEVRPNNSVVRVADQGLELYVQLDDMVETDYLSQVPEPSFSNTLAATLAQEGE
jgi:predicted small secreted protein